MLQEIFMPPQLSMLQNLQDFVIAKIGEIQDFDYIKRKCHSVDSFGLIYFLCQPRMNYSHLFFDFMSNNNMTIFD